MYNGKLLINHQLKLNQQHVQWKATDKPPAKAEPTTHEGIT